MRTPNDRLIRALRASRDARLTGALRVDAREDGVTIFFDAGHVYFATIDGRRPTTESFKRHGITREMLDDASRAPRANDRFADALMSVGAPATSVRAFGMRCALNGLTRAAQLHDATFSAQDLAHPYGPAFTFETDQLLDSLGFERVTSEPPPVTEAGRPDPAEVTDPKLQGLGFRRRTALRPAAAASQQG